MWPPDEAPQPETPAGPSWLEGRTASSGRRAFDRARWPSSASACSLAARCSLSPPARCQGPRPPVTVLWGLRPGPALDQGDCSAPTFHVTDARPPSTAVVSWLSPQGTPGDIRAHGGCSRHPGRGQGCSCPHCGAQSSPEGLSSPRCRWGRCRDTVLAQAARTVTREVTSSAARSWWGPGSRHVLSPLHLLPSRKSVPKTLTGKPAGGREADTPSRGTAPRTGVRGAGRSQPPTPRVTASHAVTAHAGISTLTFTGVK